MGTEKLDCKQNGHQTKIENKATRVLSERKLFLAKHFIHYVKASIEVQSNPRMIYNIHSSTRSEIQLCQNAEFAWIITLLQKTRCSDLLIVLHQRLMLAFRNWYMIRRDDTNFGTRQSIFVKVSAVSSTSCLTVAMIYADQRIGCQVHVNKDRDIMAVHHFPSPIVWLQLGFGVHTDHYEEVRLQRMILG